MSQNFIQIFQVSSEILAKNYNVVKVGKTLLPWEDFKYQLYDPTEGGWTVTESES